MNLLKTFIALILLASVSFAQFQTFDVAKEVTPKTCTDADYIKLVDNFALGNSVTATMLATGIESGVIESFYTKIREIESYCISLITDMGSGEIPEEITEKQLSEFIADGYKLTPTLATYLVGKITQYSKRTKDGNFTFYKNAILSK